MKIADRQPGTSIWNNKQGWLCEPLPALEPNQIAVIIDVKNGMPRSQLEQSLKSLKVDPHYYYLGDNDPKNNTSTTLVYLVKVCASSSEVLEVIARLQSAGIPISAIAAINFQLHKLLFCQQLEQKQIA